MNVTTRWQPRCVGQDSAASTTLQKACGVSPDLARLLVARGHADVDSVQQFLDAGLARLPDPFALRGMEAAVVRLCRALADQELVVVHGDYDVDGISASALLVDVIRQLGGRVDYHIPLRLVDGYGLSAQALQAAADAGASVVISVDCGITAVEEAHFARRLGLDLIITDHHQPKEELPEATAIVNPHQPECPFPDKQLAGVGVAFFLAAGLRKRLRDGGRFAGCSEPDLREVLDLVALGTIADLVPLTGINRILVRAGLQRLNRTPRPGLAALSEVAGVTEVGCGSVGFRLAPRLNAAGRLEDARQAVALLLTDDPTFSRRTAVTLDAVNRQRQQLEQQIFDEAAARVDALGPLDERYSLVLADPAWHQGVVGIVASRLVEKYHRPTVLISVDETTGKGSARSIRGYHLFRGLQACSDLLSAFGGHEYAAGLTLDMARVAEFAQAFENSVRSQLAAEGLVKTLVYDQELLLEEVTTEFAEELARLQPFGMGNPEPVFLASEVDVMQLQEVGRGHLRFQCRQGGYSFPAIAFGMAERREVFAASVDLLYSLAFNEWRGRRSLQLRIRDVRPAQGA